MWIQIPPYEGAILRGKMLSARQLAGWLKEQGELFFYSRVQVLEKCWTKCILVARNCVEK